MNFTKEEAVKELTAKYKPRYGEPAKWERTITESVEHAIELIGEDSEIELDAFVGKVSKFLDTTGGMVLKETSDVANGQKAQIEDLKKQLEGKKETKAEPDSELLKRLEALEKASEESRRLETIKSKRAEIADKLKAKGVKDENWIGLQMGMAHVEAETDTEKMSDSYLELYNKMFADRHDDDGPKPSKGEPSDRYKSVIDKAAQIAKDRIA